MRKFEEKPATIEAEQWDGTIEGFDKLRHLIRTSSSHVRYHIHTNFVSDGSADSFIEFDRDFNTKALDGRTRMYKNDWLVKALDGRTRMYKNDWLVKQFDGTLTVTDNVSFERLYKEISGA